MPPKNTLRQLAIGVKDVTRIAGWKYYGVFFRILHSILDKAALPLYKIATLLMEVRNEREG